MNVAEVTAKAKVLLEALPYIQDFHGSTFVIKYGGSFMDDPDPAARTRVAFDIAFLAACGINVVVVHGGGKAITKAMETSGLKANFINGLRVTDDATIAVVKKTLDEVVNKDVCDAIATAKGKPRGMPGDSVLVCEKLTTDDDGNPVDLGYVGEVTGVNLAPLLDCIEKGITPVISPTARGEDGKIYNCNADVAAAQAAIALKAKRLVFMSDVPGLLQNPKSPDTVISRLMISEVDSLKQRGVVDKGMIPKVDSAVAAIKAGVEKVSLVDGRVPHAVLLEIFTDEGIGTEVVA